MAMATLRELQERREADTLSPHAVLSAASRGRAREMAPCPVRTCFQRDRDRILHSKSFRRLKYKTQVFIAPEGDDYRTRLTHTLEVSQIARTIARALQLNEDLAEAVALGHDLGHTPFGHAGEAALNELLPGGFEHADQSCRIVQTLENGSGLNLSWEVVDGIRNHGLSDAPHTLEGVTVQLSDKIAYINHDLDDARRAGLPVRVSDAPPGLRALLSMTHGDRIGAMVDDVLAVSLDQPCVRMSEGMFAQMLELRKFLFSHVYKHPKVKAQEDKAKDTVRKLYDYCVCHPDILPDAFACRILADGLEVAACDYVANMTDRSAVRLYNQWFLPGTWK